MNRPEIVTRRIKLCLCLLLFIDLVSAPSGQGEAPPSEVSATGNLTSRSITKDELLGFTLTIRNKTSLPVSSLKLIRVPDDYAVGAVTVLTPQAGKTYFPQFSPANDILASSLAPGQNITVWGYLKARDPHRAATLMLTLSWALPSGSSSSPTSISVNLGESQVRDWYEAQWITDLTKILAVPLLLAVITALITFALNLLARNKEQREEERRQQIENIRKREEEQKEQERKKAEGEAERRRSDAEHAAAVRTETWNQMLPIVHKYTTECYLPLSSASDRLRANVKLWQADPAGATQRVAFFYLLLVGKKMAITRSTVGGFYFKDLRGEMLASECWRKHRRAILGRESTKFNLAVKASVSLLEDRETYQTFEKKFVGKASHYSIGTIQEAWDEFKKWSTRTSRVNYAMQHLLGFCLVLDYELNRPYDYWYDPQARLVLTPQMEKLLRRIAKKSDYTQKQVDEYFAKVIRPKQSG
jgi:hypothetical protein